MTVWRVYDRGTDQYRAVVALSREEAAARYIAECPPDLFLDELWPSPFEPVEGDDVARFPCVDWQREVANFDTYLGYEEWLAVKLTTDWDGL